MTDRALIQLSYGTVMLPLLQCEDEHLRVAMKPVCEMLGVDWKNQKRKLLSKRLLAERLGFRLLLAENTDGLAKDSYSIRVDRIVAYIDSLNPRMLAAKGNHAAADWVERKHEEWDSVRAGLRRPKNVILPPG